MAEHSGRDFQNGQYNASRQRPNVHYDKNQSDSNYGGSQTRGRGRHNHHWGNEDGSGYYRPDNYPRGRMEQEYRNGNNRRYEDQGHQKRRDWFRSPPRNHEQTQWQRDQRNQNQMDWDQQSSRGSRHRRDEDSDRHLSKTLSFLLRHGAERAGFTLMPGGFLYVVDILKQQRSLEGYTVEDVIRIVETNDKQRFALQKDENGRLKIRANQGHSIEVEDLDLTPVTNAEEFPVVIHGTYFSSWDIIKKQGLSRMTRNHIHFSVGEPGENGVISGMRSSCEVMIFMDLQKALQDGIKFFKSANNVILSPGDKSGVIYPKYFKNVLQRHPRQMLQFDTTISESTGGDAEPRKKRKKKNKHKQKEKTETDSKPKESRNTTSSKEDDSMEVEPNVSVLYNDSDNDTEGDRNEMDVDDKADIDKSESTPETMESAQETCPETWEDAEDMHADKKPSDGNDEDVIFEEEYEIKEVFNKDEFIHEVDTILKSRLPIAVCCYGNGLENPGGKIKKILCATENQMSVFHVDGEEDIIHTGKLDELLTSRQPIKVLHNCAESSRALFDQFEILLDGAELFDTKVIYDAAQEQGFGNLDQLKEVKFIPEKWKERVEDFNKDNQNEEKDKTLAILKAHKIMSDWPGNQKQWKKDIYESANSLIDQDKLADHKKKMRKSREDMKKKEKAPEKERENKQKKKKK